MRSAAARRAAPVWNPFMPRIIDRAPAIRAMTWLPGPQRKARSQTRQGTYTRTLRASPPGAARAWATMSYDVRVISISEFLRTDVSRIVDLEASRTLLRNLVEMAARRDVDRILLDGR